MSQEIELKLRFLNPGDSTLLGAHPVLAQARRTPPRQLRNRYFDTPKLNFALCRYRRALPTICRRGGWKCHALNFDPELEMPCAPPI